MQKVFQKGLIFNALHI